MVIQYELYPVLVRWFNNVSEVNVITRNKNYTRNAVLTSIILYLFYINSNMNE